MALSVKQFPALFDADMDDVGGVVGVGVKKPTPVLSLIEIAAVIVADAVILPAFFSISGGGGGSGGVFFAATASSLSASSSQDGRRSP